MQRRPPTESPSHSLFPIVRRTPELRTRAPPALAQSDTPTNNTEYAIYYVLCKLESYAHITCINNDERDANGARRIYEWKITMTRVLCASSCVCVCVCVFVIGCNLWNQPQNRVGRFHTCTHIHSHALPQTRKLWIECNLMMLIDGTCVWARISRCATHAHTHTHIPDISFHKQHLFIIIRRALVYLNTERECASAKLYNFIPYFCAVAQIYGI